MTCHMEPALTAANQSSVAYAVLPDVDPYAATEYLRDEQPYDHEHGDGDSDDGAYSPTKVTGPSKPPSATAGPAKPVITDDEPLRLDASFACVIFIGFVSQVEYAVIMPSMWQYVESLGGSHLYFGFAMASFSACRMVTLTLTRCPSDPQHLPLSLCLHTGIDDTGTLDGPGVNTIE